MGGADAPKRVALRRPPDEDSSSQRQGDTVRKANNLVLQLVVQAGSKHQLDHQISFSSQCDDYCDRRIV